MSTPASPSATHVRQSLTVAFEYTVSFTEDALAPSNPALLAALTAREPHRRHKVFVVYDRGVEAAWPDLHQRISTYFAHHKDQLRLVAAPYSMPGGEAAKNDPALITSLHTAFHRHHMDRHSFVLILGGGGVLDAAGYAAATAHRGLRVVRMPTTVLAQNDSGVGVKNGVNAFGAKNYLGTFVPPFAVVNDRRFLERLPRREKIAGLAEAVKVALIRDAAFFSWLEEHADALAAADPTALGTLIRRCAELHLAHIAGGGDPFELGSARPLDFGHWAAHKLEALTSHELRHGEAVAIGLHLDARYSVEVGLLSEADFARITRLLKRLTLPTYHPALLHAAADGDPMVLAGLEEFREHLGGDLTITLLAGLGRGVEVNHMDEARIVAAARYIAAAGGP